MRHFKKIISLLTAAAFLFSTGKDISFASMPSVSNTVLAPSALGKVSLGANYGDGKLIINIQDVHSDPKTQKNISEILSYIDQNFNIDELYLEGAPVNYSQSPAAKLFKGKYGKEISETLLNGGYISGAEYYGAIKNEEGFLKGIEDSALYQRNMLLLGQIVKLRPEIDAVIKELDDGISTLTKIYFNETSKKAARQIAENNISKLLALAENNSVSVNTYTDLRLYSSLLQKEKSVNFKTLKSEIGSFVSVLKKTVIYSDYKNISNLSGNFSSFENIAQKLLSYKEVNRHPNVKQYLEYLLLKEDINFFNVLNEKNLLENALFENTALSAYEEEVSFLYIFLPLVKDYFTANISPQNLTAFYAGWPEFKKSWCNYFSNSTPEKLLKHETILKEFHQNNIARDGVFTRALLGGKGKIKVIVTGGFHSESLEKFFKENKISYAVITPNSVSRNTAYYDNLEAYAEISVNTINIEPFFSKPVNAAFPQLYAAAAAVISKEKNLTQNVKTAALKEYMDDFLLKHKSAENYNHNAAVTRWQTDSFTNSSAEFSVLYDISGKKVELHYSTENGIVKNTGNITQKMPLLSIFSKYAKTSLKAPIIEEFIFRIIPFITSFFAFGSGVSMPVVAITAITGIIAFTAAHYIADIFYAKKRQYFTIGIASVFITGSFLTAALLLPPPFAVLSLPVPVFLHVINNSLASKGVRLPALNITGRYKKETTIRKRPFIKFFNNIYHDEDAAEENKYFTFSRLLEYLPENILPKQDLAFTPETKISVNHAANTNALLQNELIEAYNKFQEIKDYNNSALTLINEVNVSGKMPDKKLKNVILGEVAKMIELFEYFSPEKSQDALIALLDIKKLLLSSDNMHILAGTLDRWDPEKIYEITNLNSLINAVHQSSANMFKEKINSAAKKIDSDGAVSEITITHGDTKITSYDILNDAAINAEIQNMLVYLAESDIGTIDKNDYFVIIGDIVFWTQKLNAHSVDALFDFSDGGRSVSITFHEPNRSMGSAERIKYFTEILKSFGFEVKADTKHSFYYDEMPGTCGLEAILSKDSGLNDSVNLAYVSYKTVELFKYSTHINAYFGKNAERLQKQSYKTNYFDKVIEKFKAGYIKYQFDPRSETYKLTDNKGRYIKDDNGDYATAERALGFKTERDMTDMPESPYFNGRRGISEYLNNILRYLNLPDIKSSSQLSRAHPSVIDEYLNKPIREAYLKGDIFIGEDGILRPKENNDLIKNFLDERLANGNDMLKQARIFNTLGNARFNYQMEGFTGSLMFMRGSFKTPTGELFIKGLANPYTGRFKFASCELVNISGRKSLNSDDVIDFFVSCGINTYDGEYEEISQKEKEKIEAFINSDIAVIDTPEMRSTSTSDGTGGYVFGNINFDRKNITENDIMLVPYTTPDDIDAIKTSKGVITTGGGTLSHAAITTREMGKPSVILNNVSLPENAKQTEIVYYVQEGSIEEYNGIKIKRSKPKKRILQNGERVLLNGETGRILLFNDIDIGFLDEIQSHIGTKNFAQLKDILANYTGSHLPRIAEYVYFQCADSKDLYAGLEMLFSADMPSEVRRKVEELNRGYIYRKMRSANETLESLKSIDNVSVKYLILLKLHAKLENVKTINITQKEFAVKNNVKNELGYMKLQMSGYMDNIIEKLWHYLDKEKLDSKEISDAIRQINAVKAAGFYIPQNETGLTLIDKRRELMETCKKLETKITAYQAEAPNPTFESEIKDFDGIFLKDSYRFGSKTSELAEMYRLFKSNKNVVVPMGIGLSKNVILMYFKALGKEQEFNGLIQKFNPAVGNKDELAALFYGSQIEKLIDSIDLNDATAKEITAKISLMLDTSKKYSVRSSGIGEDSANKAFAGMGETKLNVKSAEVFESVKESWKSFYKERSIKYMANSGIAVEPAVLIQEMANVEKAGVIFSLNKRGNAIIEVVYGLGEGHVSGVITPDKIEINLSAGEVIEYSAANKSKKLVALENGTEYQNVSSGATSRALNSEEIKRLTEALKMLISGDSEESVEKHAIGKDDNGNSVLYILQQRPQTSIDGFVESIEPATIERAPEISHTVSLAVADLPAVEFCNIEFAGKPVTVYSATANETGAFTMLYLNETNASLIQNQDFLNKLAERLNNDPVILEKFNRRYGLTLSCGQIGTGIYHDTVFLLNNEISNKSIAAMLQAA